MTDTTLFCTTHQHDGLVDELIQDYGCGSKQQLHGILMDALQWADRHYLGFVEEIGDGVGWTVCGGTEINRYRGRRSVTIWADHDNVECPVYRQLMKAALALFALTTPILRRDIERPVPDWEADPTWHYYDLGDAAFDDAG
jgi:hypothetical protein